MSEDGKTLYLVFSGDDHFSVRKATLKVADDSIAQAPHLGRTLMFCRPLPGVKRFWIQVTVTTQYKSTLALAILLLAVSVAPAGSPYPPSPLIADISLNWSTHERRAWGATTGS